jgi:UDP-N-acetylglucosamine 3-dehydrogenase
MIEFDSTKSVPLTLAPSQGASVSESPLGRQDDPFYCELHAFIEALSAGVPPPVTVQDAREAVRIALAALESIQTGKPVTLI